MSTLLGSAAWSTDPGHWRYEPLGADGPAVAGGGRFLLLGENPNVRRQSACARSAAST